MKTDKSIKDLAIEAANKRAYARAYYQAHKGQARLYYIRNAELVKARAALWRLQNRERYLEQQADYDKNRRVSIKAPEWITEHNKEVKRAGPPFTWQ